MPRPRATKIKTTIPPSKRLEAQSEASVAPHEPLRHLRSPHLASSSFGEDSDGLVTKTRNPSRRAAKAAESEEYTMTGALGFSDLKNAHRALDEQNRVIQSVRMELQKEDEKKVGGRVGGLLGTRSTNQAAKSGGLSAPGKRRTLVAAGEEEEDEQEQGLQMNGNNDYDNESSPRVTTQPQESRSQEQLVRNEETQLVEKVTDSFPPTQEEPPASSSKALATPSILSISNFKRRPRQPSILRMVQHRLENEDDDQHDLELELDGDSTLLGPLISSSPPPSNRESSVIIPSTEQANTSSSKKRKLQAFERADSSPLSSPPQSPSSHSKRTRLSSKIKHIFHHDTAAEGESTRSSYTSSDSNHSKPPPSRPADPGQLSSSPSVSLPERLTRNRRVSQRQTAMKANNRPVTTVEQATSPISTPPTSSAPASPVKHKTKPPPKPKPLSTASLQAFLPRRRRFPRGARPNASTFDILSSSDMPSAEEDDDDDDSDADELGRRGRLRKKVKKIATNKRGPAAKTSKGAATSGKKTPVKGSKTSASRTYGRRTSMAGDKENPGIPQSDGASSGEEDNDEIISVQHVSPETAKKSKELQAAAAKFAEVDEWELDFESQDVGHDGRGSSPWR